MYNTGSLAVGKAADLVLYDIDKPRFAGVHVPLMSPLMCGEPVHVKNSFIQGTRIVSDGCVAGLDETELTQSVRNSVAALLNGV